MKQQAWQMKIIDVFIFFNIAKSLVSIGNPSNFTQFKQTRKHGCTLDYQSS